MREREREGEDAAVKSAFVRASLKKKRKKKKKKKKKDRT